MKRILPIALCISIAASAISHATLVRVKDLCAFQNKQETDLIGYGLVIGLDGTGDGNGTQFTTQSLVNMMERMGLTVDQSKVKVKNVAAVMVTARLSSFQQNGTYVDVTVSSVGDAKSLQGGTLLVTPLSDAGGTVRANAQGSVSIGGFNVQVDDRNKIVNNYTVVGRVPNGARVTHSIEGDSLSSKELFVTVTDPDFTTANRIAQRVNLHYGTIATPLDAGTIKIMIPDTLMDPLDRMELISTIGLMEIAPDAPSRVVINERTGTIVAGGNVTIEPVAIAHGTITVTIQSTPQVSQPQPFSMGQTVTTQQSQISVQDENAHVVYLPPTVNLSDVAMALNKIGATPRDIIAIFQALKQAGALRCELVVL
jgi:flagellar P-ring protein precursor FlgI